jgi:hypothetical protein
MSDAPPESEHSMPGPSGIALPFGADLIKDHAEPSTTVHDSGLPVLDLGLSTSRGCQAETSLSIDIETLHLFNPSKFQQLLDITAARTVQAPGSSDRRGLGVIPTPGRFTIDPLHFLGITPTAQSSELLQACKLIHCGMRY